MRIVSLLPSATEIVYALGLGDDLVAVTFECDEPPTARRDKAVVVGGRDTSAMTPGEIDRYVRDTVAAGGDLYTLDAQALGGLDADLVITQDLCRVCALPTDRVEDALGYLGCRAEVVSLDPHSLDDVLASIRTVARAAGVEARADDVIAGLTARLDRVAAQTAQLATPSVAVIEWVDPPFTAGHWVPDLVAAAGGFAVSAQPHGRSAQTSWQAIRDARPDMAIVAPCGFDLAQACAQAAVVVEQLPGTPVWALDANGLVVRPGPRLVAGVEAIAAILHPDAVPPAPADAIARVAPAALVAENTGVT